MKIAFINHKGGIGKTTLAVNTAFRSKELKRDLLCDVAKQEGKRYHTLATDFIIAGVKKLEKKYNKNS